MYERQLMGSIIVLLARLHVSDINFDKCALTLAVGWAAGRASGLSGGTGMVICLERGADLHMAQLIPLPLTVSCFRKIQIGFTFVVQGHLGSPGQRAVVCVCVVS